jgi:predicted RND superfamily exporter protein
VYRYYKGLFIGVAQYYTPPGSNPPFLMTSSLTAFYDKLVLQHPGLALAGVVLLIAFLGWHSSDFRLDASADALVLENDDALHYYREARERYGSDDYLIVTYTLSGDLFSEATLADLRELRDELAALERVKSVISILDVPLINSPPVKLSDLEREKHTLDSPGTDKALAQQEFVDSPLYRNLIISPDKTTTALQVNFKRDETYFELLNERDRLREKRSHDKLTPQEAELLDTVSRQFNTRNHRLQVQQHEDIAAVRRIMERHRARADLYLGGVPMIAADSIDFIRHDLRVFGLGVLCILVTIFALAFRKPRWVVLPMLTCTAAGLAMVGFLGLVDWPVTVVSSNFISLMLIITLSLTIHLIIRYRELCAANPSADQYSLVRATIRKMAIPCFYTAITTMVAFGSLLFSGIRPVIDFGWMMAIGIAVAFLLSFILFPATLMFLKPVPPTTTASHRLTAAITRFFATLIERHGKAVTGAFILIVILSIAGITRLTVENRFIDYYKPSTEIYRGMELIDHKLGGTTPLDVILDAPESFLHPEEPPEEDPFMDEFDRETAGSAGITGTSYWFNSYRLEEVAAIHDYLDDLPESGKVLSIITAVRMLKSLQDGASIDDYFLSILYRRMPDDIRETLFTPYLSADGNQVRFSIRVFESDESLRRADLLQKIHDYLTDELRIDESRVHLTGMLVLYNNMLQSLFHSQIMTLGVVFSAIMLMFLVLFRSLKMAVIAIIPNVVAAVQVLGLMGWLNIPLDIMTITIAAIVIGIAVDDTIHYIHRFTEEYRIDHDYWASVKRCHASIGHAMYYTTMTITLGFAILALSSFIPTIYFGLLTGFSMLVALLADLALLPLLITGFKPLGANQ